MHAPKRFEQQALPHLDAAYSLAFWLMRDRADAEDVVQDAYIRALRAFDGFRGENMRPWLLAIVRNVAWRALANRRRATSNVIPIEASLHTRPGEDDPEPMTIASDEPSAETRLIEAGDRALLTRALDALTPLFREALVLREVEEMSYADIATVLGIPPGTVMSRLSRARAELRLRFKELASGALPLKRLTNMRCEEVQDLASAWLDNQLSEPRAGMVAEHETGCEACHAYIADLRLLAEQMATYGREPAPPGLAERVRVSIAEEQGRSPIPETRAGAGWLRRRPTTQAMASPGCHGRRLPPLHLRRPWAVMRVRRIPIPATEHDVVAAHVRSLLQNSTDPGSVERLAHRAPLVRRQGGVRASGEGSRRGRDFRSCGGRLDYADGTASPPWSTTMVRTRSACSSGPSRRRSPPVAGRSPGGGVECVVVDQGRDGLRRCPTWKPAKAEGPRTLL